MLDRQAQTRRRAIVEDIDGEPLQPDDLGKAIDDAGQIVEGVAERLM